MKRQKREAEKMESDEEWSSRGEEIDNQQEREVEEERLRLEKISQEKKHYLQQLVQKGIKGGTNEQKIQQIVNIAEALVNFLLTRNRIGEKSKKKTHIDKNVDEDVIEDSEEIVFLTEQPSFLKNGYLKDHQMVGLNWLISLYSIGFNGILADEMGLGKTIQTIAFFAYLAEYKKIRGPHLIVCPNSVVPNWYKEFQKWFPGLRIVKLIARKEFREDIIKDQIHTKQFDVIIVSYEGVSICQQVLRKIKWIYIVVDEAHRIKNDLSLLSVTLRKFKSEMKLLITGTPLQNNLRELWSLLNFILPEIFDDSTLFEEQTDKEMTQEQIESKNIELITQLHKILRPFLLKRTKAIIDKSIPPKKEIHVLVGLTKLQTEIYRNLLLKKSPTQNSKTSMMNILMHLRKTCNHPYLFDGVEDPNQQAYGDHLITSSGKMIILDKILERLKYNHQVIIFSQFKIMLDILEDYLIYKEFKYCRIDGDTFLDERENQIEEFSKKDSDKFVFLLSTRAGGLGINLTSADTVILYDSDWNPQVDLQAMDRAHRIGQTKVVMVYRFITENTVEEKMVERQKVKLKWDNLVILKGKVSQKQKMMNKNELEDLIQFGANQIFKTSEGTIKNEDLDILLERGEKRAQEMEQKIDEYIKEKGEKLLDLGINTINIYEFEGSDYLKKRQNDREVLDQKRYEYQETLIGPDRFKKRNMVTSQDVVKKQILLPDYHLYDEKNKLEDILTRETNGEMVTDEE